MDIFPLPLSPSILDDIRLEAPWLQSIVLGTVQEAIEIIHERCGKIRDPWVKSTVSNILTGTPIAIGKESTDLYPYAFSILIDKAGVTQRAFNSSIIGVSASIEAMVIAKSLRPLGFSDLWLFELLGQCNTLRTGEFSGFFKFDDPISFSKFIKTKFAGCENVFVTEVFEKGAICSLSASRFKPDIWICLYYNASGDFLLMNGEKSLAWYLQGQNRIVPIPIDIRAFIENVVDAKTAYGAEIDDVYEFLNHVGLSDAYM